MLDQQQTGDFVVIIIVIGAMVIGLISMLVGWVVERWDRFCAWWEEGFEHARAKRGVSSKEIISPPVSAYESEVSPVSGFVSPPESSAESAVASVLARLIIAEELDLTTAVKIGCGKKSGEGYQKWSRLVKAAIEEQRESETPIAGRPTQAKFAPDTHR